MPLVTVLFDKIYDSFCSDGEVHFIVAGVDVLSPTTTPALTTADHQELVLWNFGEIKNSYGVGLLITEDSYGDFDNYGLMAGSRGVVVHGYASALNNHGDIVGLNTDTSIGVLFASESTSNNVYNYGKIRGGLAGIQDNSAGDGPVIENHGLIEGKRFGLNANNTSDYGMTVYNDSDGTIRGSEAAIMTKGTAAISLSNWGVVDGKIVLTAVPSADAYQGDSILNWGQIHGSVSLGLGDDQFNNIDDATSGSVWGGGGSDQLIGGNNHDVLNGGAGDDYLEGGSDDDTLTGGIGWDTFVFGSALSHIGVDTIRDFVHGDDGIALETRYFTKLGPTGSLAAARFFVGAAAHDASDRIVYNPSNGYLIYDSNGNAAGGSHHFATLDANLNLTHADFLVWQ